MRAMGRLVPRRWLLAAAAIGASVTVTTTVLLAADLYLHRRAERSAGLNRWGYRGPVAGRKQPRETRIAIFGGSTVFGYGVFWDQTIPALLERELRANAVDRRVTVVNLGFNNEGAHALVPTLDDFDDLQLDIAVFYTGYNDYWGDAGPNTAVYRHESPVFRMFGYYPILPLMLKEKAMAIRSGGQLSAAENAASIGTPKPVFTPSLAERTTATAMETAVKVSDVLSAQLDRLSRGPAPQTQPSDAGCNAPWVTYCESLYRAIRHGRAKRMTIMVVLPPLMTKFSRARHQDQQAATAAMLLRKFQGDEMVRSVDLSRTVDLEDRHVSFDEMHLDPDGNAVIARALAPHVRTLIGKAAN